MWNVKKLAITQHRDENNNNHKWKTDINKDWVNIQIDGNRNPSIVDWVNDSGWHELKTLIYSLFKVHRTVYAKCDWC